MEHIMEKLKTNQATKTEIEHLKEIAGSNGNLRVVSISNVYTNEFSERTCDIRFHLNDLRFISEKAMDKIEDDLRKQFNAKVAWVAGEYNMLRVRMN
jgi:hypothetical protein